MKEKREMRDNFQSELLQPTNKVLCLTKTISSLVEEAATRYEIRKCLSILM